MYGKWFDSAYTGSMCGAGACVFAVWSYVIANAGPEGVLEINPKLLAAMIGEPEQRIVEAMEYLMAPDPASRSPDEGGARIVREGAFQFRVVNHSAYRSMKDEGGRREYNRIKKRESRARLAGSVKRSVRKCQPKQRQTQRSEADAEIKEVVEDPQGQSVAHAIKPEPEFLDPSPPPYPIGTIPDRLPGEQGAAACSRNLTRVLEQGFGTTGFDDANFTFRAAQRLIANESATLDEIADVLDAWNAGTHPDVPKIKIFQMKHWPKVRAACLATANTHTNDRREDPR